MEVGSTPSGAFADVYVPHEGAGVRIARHAFAEQLDDAGVATEDRHDAMLVLSELVSNAVKHAAPLPGGRINVRWQVAEEVLHIEITDGGGGTRPNPSVPVLSALGGRGLDIVRTVSSQWGVTEHQSTVTVWAKVPRNRARANGRRPSGVAAH